MFSSIKYISEVGPVRSLGALALGIGVSSSALLALMMAFPMVLAVLYVKAFLFAVLLVFVAVGYFSGHSHLDYRIALWTVGLALVSFLFVIRGLLAVTPGAGNAALIYIFWPIVYVCWISGLAEKRLLLSLSRTAIVSTLFIGLYGCLYLLTQLQVIPETKLVSALSLGWDAESFGAQEGYTAMAIPGMNSLPFLLPYVMANLAVPSAWVGRGRGWRIVLWTAAALGWVTVLAAARRALLLVMLLSPLLILLLRSFLPETEKSEDGRWLAKLSFGLAGVMGATFIGLTLMYDFDVRLLWDRFVAGFDLSAQTLDLSAVERRTQFFALSRGWLNNPLWGVGHGASVLGSIRSETMPWSYELYYLALLYQTGLVGFTAYTAGIVWVFRKGLEIIREGGDLGRLMLPMLAGCTGFLIAAGTNPYLERFDGLWFLFLPLAVVNYRLSPFRR